MRHAQLADSHILLPQTCSTAVRSNAVAYRRLTPIHSAPSDTLMRLPRKLTLMISDSTNTLHLLPSQSPLHSSGACSDCALGPHTTSLLVLHTHTYFWDFFSYSLFLVVSRRRGWRTQLARLYVWLPRLPVAGAHVTPLGGGRRLAVTVTSLAGGQRGP